jgi:hypothetical protein
LHRQRKPHASPRAKPSPHEKPGHSSCKTKQYNAKAEEKVNHQWPDDGVLRGIHPDYEGSTTATHTPCLSQALMHSTTRVLNPFRGPSRHRLSPHPRPHPHLLLAEARAIELNIQFFLFWMPLVTPLSWRPNEPLSMLFGNKHRLVLEQKADLCH